MTPLTARMAQMNWAVTTVSVSMVTVSIATGKLHDRVSTSNNTIEYIIMVLQFEMYFFLYQT